MRILSVVRRDYYGNSNARDPLSYFFTAPLRKMGHDVETLTTLRPAEPVEGITRLRSLSGKFEALSSIWYFIKPQATNPSTLCILKAFSNDFIAAWNSDDDWQWETTRQFASHFTYMITTYPGIYERYRTFHSNLLLSQWGCLGLFSDFGRKKDLDFSFAGAIFRSRSAACRYLSHRSGLKCFGRGAHLVRMGIPYFPGAFRLYWMTGKALQYEDIYDIWNRTRVSYSPMSGGPRGDVLSIKARTFEMGLSGTLMLCEHSPYLERYDPGRECITFESLEDCAEKAQWYLSHESERVRIVTRYYERTLREHMWEHRFDALFREMGLNQVHVKGKVLGAIKSSKTPAQLGLT